MLDKLPLLLVWGRVPCIWPDEGVPMNNLLSPMRPFDPAIVGFTIFSLSETGRKSGVCEIEDEVLRSKRPS